MIYKVIIHNFWWFSMNVFMWLPADLQHDERCCRWLLHLPGMLGACVFRWRSFPFKHLLKNKRRVLVRLSCVCFAERGCGRHGVCHQKRAVAADRQQERRNRGHRHFLQQERRQAVWWIRRTDHRGLGSARQETSGRIISVRLSSSHPVVLFGTRLWPSSSGGRGWTATPTTDWTASSTGKTLLKRCSCTREDAPKRSFRPSWSVSARLLPHKYTFHLHALASKAFGTEYYVISFLYVPYFLAYTVRCTFFA